MVAQGAHQFLGVEGIPTGSCLDQLGYLLRQLRADQAQPGRRQGQRLVRGEGLQQQALALVHGRQGLWFDAPEFTFQWTHNHGQQQRHAGHRQRAGHLYRQVPRQ